MDPVHHRGFGAYLQCESDGLLGHPAAHADQKGILQCISGGTDCGHHLPGTKLSPYPLLRVYREWLSVAEEGESEIGLQMK
jgi:hypothetical protein